MHAQLCPTLCDAKDCSPSGSSTQGILQARILEWVAISSSKGSNLHLLALAGSFFTTEPPRKSIGVVVLLILCL